MSFLPSTLIAFPYLKGKESWDGTNLIASLYLITVEFVGQSFYSGYQCPVLDEVQELLKHVRSCPFSDCSL